MRLHNLLRLIKKVEDGTASQQEKILVLQGLNAAAAEYIDLLKLRISQLQME